MGCPRVCASHTHACDVAGNCCGTGITAELPVLYRVYVGHWRFEFMIGTLRCCVCNVLIIQALVIPLILGGYLW